MLANFFYDILPIVVALMLVDTISASVRNKGTTVGPLSRTILFLPAILATLLVMLLVMPFANNWRKRQELLLPKKLAEGGRFLEWHEVEQRLRLGDGTLIVEYDRTPRRFWWVAGDIVESAPVPLVSAQSEEWSVDGRVLSWMSGFLDIAKGSAKLTNPQDSAAEQLARRFPDAAFVTLAKGCVLEGLPLESHPEGA